MERQVISKRQGYKTVDGAGVSLVRVLGHSTTKDFSPILMLDSFDSTNYEEYKAGFPIHPHRGIETISYLSSGKMMHKDSLGNEDTISSGEVQFMTAGSGILHEEQLPKSEKLLGVQLWLNLPANKKMVSPNYKAIKNEEIPEIEFDGGKLRLLCGNYKEFSGYQAKNLPLDYYDISMEIYKSIEIETENDKSIMLFTLSGEVLVSGEIVKEKTAVKLSKGDFVKIKAISENVKVLFISSDELDESIAWGGPIVMNTQEELKQAYEDLKTNNFIQDKILY